MKSIPETSLRFFSKALAHSNYDQNRTNFESCYCPRLERLSFGSVSPAKLADPVSQLCTASQFQELVYNELCAEIDEVPRFHRKQWEFAYILSVLKKHGKLTNHTTGLGFGCGREPLPAAFAKYGCNVLATDLAPDEAVAKGWTQSGQHSGSLNELYNASSRFIERDLFYTNVSYKQVDMNNIPCDFHDAFDFVWSACCLEHLGSLEAGMQFIIASLACLKPGGVAVHTTEFNLSSNTETIETPHVCLYRHQDILRLLSSLPHGVNSAYLNLDTGCGVVDEYIDVPPYLPAPHLKMLLGSFVTTSIGLVFVKD
jgi:SAM-dependent methyltransferase